ncbi:MAG: hypothetical protein R2789_04495 [Microthrixaceae bacterium]
MREQLAVGVHTLVAQRGATFLGGGEDRTIGRHDVAAWFVEVALQDPGVLRAVGQGLGLEHLHLVELQEQDRVEDQEGDSEATDLAGHGATAGCATRRAAWSAMRIRSANRT